MSTVVAKVEGTSEAETEAEGTMELVDVVKNIGH